MNTIISHQSSCKHYLHCAVFIVLFEIQVHLWFNVGLLSLWNDETERKQHCFLLQPFPETTENTQTEYFETLSMQTMKKYFGWIHTRANKFSFFPQDIKLLYLSVSHNTEAISTLGCSPNVHLYYYSTIKYRLLG